jgi:hypothetical protein
VWRSLDSRHAMWKTGCVIAVALLCGCTDAVYMRNACGETGKCGSVDARPPRPAARALDAYI